MSMEDLLASMRANQEAKRAKPRVAVNARVPMYFQIQHDADGDRFLITAQNYYDKHGCLNDSWADSHYKSLPNGFEELMESEFAYDGDTSEGRQLLLDSGHIEREMF